MTQHVPEDLLLSFVEGDVDEPVAAHIAEHLDGCPACATRAASLEPLAAAFAAIADPAPPPHLVAAILARVDEPERLPVAEIAVGAGLLGTAALLALGLENPVTLVTQLVVVLNASIALARGVATGLGSFQFALAATAAMTFAGGLLTLHYGATPPAALRRVP